MNMGKKSLRWLLVAGLVFGASFGAVAHADIENDGATNVQEGDNDTESEQEGDSSSGDAVAGSVVGVVSSGDASVDATNRSEDVDVETGDASGENSSSSFTGLTAGSETVVGDGGGDGFFAEDILNFGAVNVQEGDNETDLSQSADVSSGDGVGGQVIGVVTAAGGSADVVAANTSEDVEIDTGDAESDNDATAFTGLNPAGPVFLASDIANASATNVQEGDNDFSADQDANASSGDGVGGQVLGVVSAGDASVDATNRSEDVEVETGEVLAENDVAGFVGLTAASGTFIGELDGDGLLASDIANASATNVQEGDNEKDVSQSADASSGDAVGGQVAGVVTSAGGSADLVLANTSVDSEAETGEAEFFNDDESFTGLNASGVILVPEKNDRK
jgi:hypothetical protein